MSFFTSKEEKKKWEELEVKLSKLNLNASLNPEKVIKNTTKIMYEVITGEKMRNKKKIGNETKGLVGLYNAVIDKNKMGKGRTMAQLEILATGKDGNKKIIGFFSSWKKFKTIFSKIKEAANNHENEIKIKQIERLYRKFEKFRSEYSKINDPNSLITSYIKDKSDDEIKEYLTNNAKQFGSIDITNTKIKGKIAWHPEIFDDICEVIDKQSDEIENDAKKFLKEYDEKAGEITKAYQKLKNEIPKGTEENVQNFFNYVIELLDIYLLKKLYESYIENIKK